MCHRTCRTISVRPCFQVDARARFELEPDAAAWGDRLTVIAMDLRDLPALERQDLLTGSLIQLHVLVPETHDG